MMTPQTMVVVDDVGAASAWFQAVLGLTSAHGGPEYEMLMDGETLVMQLHQWEADEHPHLGNPTDPSRGNGILLWFFTDDFDALVSRVESASAVVLEGPLNNPNSHLREVWLQTPHGYTVVVSGD